MAGLSDSTDGDLDRRMVQLSLGQPATGGDGDGTYAKSPIAPALPMDTTAKSEEPPVPMDVTAKPQQSNDIGLAQIGTGSRPRKRRTRSLRPGGDNSSHSSYSPALPPPQTASPLPRRPPDDPDKALRTASALRRPRPAPPSPSEPE